MYTAGQIYFLFVRIISVQNQPTGSETCPDPTPANGSIFFNSEHNTDTFPERTIVQITCNQGFQKTGTSLLLPIICEEHGIWSRPPPECIPDNEGE